MKEKSSMSRPVRTLGCLAAAAAAVCLWHFLPDIYTAIVTLRAPVD